MNPKISILAPSFNHEKFVGFFIESVLAQTFSDFECIIVDDCSSDRNVEEIQKYKDARIKLVRQPYNQGINASLNTAFENASGEYLVFCATDDMLKSNALEVLYSALEKNPDAKVIYPRLIQIDKDNQITKQIGFLKNIKKQTREEMLHHLFMRGNCLTSPGMSLKKQDFKEILYPLDMSLVNLQDVQMHIKLLLAGEIILLDDALILYRFDASTSNISTKTLTTAKREEVEKYKLLDTFLEIKHIAGGGLELLTQIFSREINTYSIKPRLETIKYFLGRMALLSPEESHRVWGYRQIMESYSTKEGAKKLKELYNFEFKDYLKLIEATLEFKTMYKYKKYKRAFNVALVVLLCLLFVIIFLLVKG